MTFRTTSDLTVSGLPLTDTGFVYKHGLVFYGTKKSGTGVGLNLTQRIVLGHQGHILVESAPGEGLTMIVRLPFLKDGE